MKLHNAIAAAVVLSISLTTSETVLAGTLGPCPNRGDRCYLEMNGKFNYQPGEEPIFQVGGRMLLDGVQAKVGST